MSFLPAPPRGDRCDCPCHKAPLTTIHAVPCCTPCPICGERIASARLTSHVAAHGRPVPKKRRSSLPFFAIVLAVGSVAMPRVGATASMPGIAADSTSTWAGFFAGRWSCAGAFANGQPLAADLEFSPVLAGRWLEYHHKDRPPGRYEARALWGPAERDTALATTALFDNFGGRRAFFVRAAHDSGVTLARDTSEPGARAERFRFQPRGAAAFWFAWEVQRAGAWALGDSLACVRAAAS
jgi:hypothetical protein